MNSDIVLKVMTGMFGWLVFGICIGYLIKYQVLNANHDNHEHDDNNGKRIK